MLLGDLRVFFSGAVQRVTHCPNWDPLRRSGTEQGFDCEEIPAQMFKLIGSRAFTPGFRPIVPLDFVELPKRLPFGSRPADLLGRLSEGVGLEAFFLGRQSRPACFELLSWPASEVHFNFWPGKEAPGLMVDTPEKKTPRSQLSPTLHLTVKIIMRP